MDQNNGFIEKEVKDLARQIARERIAPNAGERDRNSAFPREAIQTLGDSGILGMVVSENHGGSGASRTAFASMTSELGCACASTALVVVSHIIAEKAIEVAATDVIKGKWLPPLMAGWALELLLCTNPTAAAMPERLPPRRGRMATITSSTVQNSLSHQRVKLTFTCARQDGPGKGHERDERAAHRKRCPRAFLWTP